MAPVGLPQNPLLGGIHRMQRHIVVRRQIEEVRNFGRKAEGGRRAEPGHQEAGLALDAWIGVLKIRQIQHGLAVQLEPCVLIGDGRVGLIVDDLGGADAPERWHARIVLTGCELALLELCDVAIAAGRALTNDAGVVLRDGAERLDETVAKVFAQRQALGPDDIAVRLAQLNVAHGRQRAGRLVVLNFVGLQNVVVVEDFDVATGTHLVALGVVDHLVALQIQRLCTVDLLRRPTEDAALLLGKRRHASARHRQTARILCMGGRTESTGEKHAA